MPRCEVSILMVSPWYGIRLIVENVTVCGVLHFSLDIKKSPHCHIATLILICNLNHPSDEVHLGFWEMVPERERGSLTMWSDL